MSLVFQRQIDSLLFGFVMLELILCKLHFSFAIWLSVKFGQKLGSRGKLKYRKGKKEFVSYYLLAIPVSVTPSMSLLPVLETVPALRFSYHSQNQPH